MYQFFPYITFSVISFATLVIITAYGVSRRNNLGANEFVFAMLASAWWVFCQAFELMALTFPVKLFWANLLYIGAGLSPFAYFLLVLRYTGYDHFITKRNIAIILTVYATFFFLIFTDGYFGLMRTNFSLDTSAVPYVIDKDFGMLFPLYMLFVHSISITSIALLVTRAMQKESVHRKQAVILLISLSVIAFSNLIHILGLSPSTRFELTPALFGFSAIFISFGIFQHKLLDLTPIARDLLVERINNGIIVIDIISRVIDINRKALELFDLDKGETLGKSYQEIAPLNEHISNYQIDTSLEEITYSKGGKLYTYELAQYKLFDKKENHVGWLVIINDVTEKKKTEAEKVRQEKAISVMSERERVGRELHDGLAQVFGYYNTQAQAIVEYLNRSEFELARQHLEQLITVAREQHGEIRSHITGIRGIAAADKNFSAALKKHVDTFSKQYSIPVEVDISQDLPPGFPDEECAVELSKIIQEALNNIHKHAGRCRVCLSFRKKQDFVELRIRDTGRGFNRGKVGVRGYGLEIMHERAASIGASLTIESVPGVGTTIMLNMGENNNHENSNCR
jgi:PAS domain S-box-containing protein